jgi:hypothetical protein
MGDIGPIRHRYEVLPDPCDERRIREQERALRDQALQRREEARRAEDLPR